MKKGDGDYQSKWRKTNVYFDVIFVCLYRQSKTWYAFFF